jgi:hypothetical protein
LTQRIFDLLIEKRLVLESVRVDHAGRGSRET